MKKYISVICALVVLSLALTGCAEKNNNTSLHKNPHEAQWLDEDMIASLDSIKRADEKGMLYTMDFKADYYSDVFTAMIKQAGMTDTGCSAFVTKNTEGDALTCRNFDYRHFDSENSETALNVLVRCSPEGKFKSIGMVDAYWLDPNGATFSAGSLDDGKTDISGAVMLPYMCTDGMNEKGLTVSMLKVELKDGEAPTHQNEAGKEKISQSVLSRYMLDNCATVEEAEKLAKSYNIFINGNALHMFVTDAEGKSAVFEWRDNKLVITDINAVTNFYVGFDDGEDFYRNGVLMEKHATFSSNEREYHFGYGHGYHRFINIVSALERYADSSEKDHVTVMSDRQARDILSVAAQDYATEGVSSTLFSLIYNQTQLTATVWLCNNFDTEYSFGMDF